MDQEVTYKPNVIKSLSDTRQSIEPQWFTWNFLKNKYLAPLSAEDTSGSASHFQSQRMAESKGECVVGCRRFRYLAFGLTCQRTLLAEAHNLSAGAHTRRPVAAYPRIMGCSSYEGTGRVTVLS